MRGFHHCVKGFHNATYRTASVFSSEKNVAKKVRNAGACGMYFLASPQVRKCQRRAGGIAVRCIALGNPYVMIETRRKFVNMLS